MTKKFQAPERQTVSNENLFKPKPFKVCWLHMQNGYHYTGTLASASFVGNKLNIVVSILVEVQEFEEGNTTKVWKPLEKTTIRKYEFQFEGCTKDHEHSNGVRYAYKSSDNDLIILSSDPEECAGVERILNDKE